MVLLQFHVDYFESLLVEKCKMFPPVHWKIWKTPERNTYALQIIWETPKSVRKKKQILHYFSWNSWKMFFLLLNTVPCGCTPFYLADL